MAKGKKTGGRQKNSLNKIPKDLKQSINEFLAEHFNEVVEEWKKLDNGRDKLNFYKDLLKYAVPTIQSIVLEPNEDAEMKNNLVEMINNKLKIKTA